MPSREETALHLLVDHLKSQQAAGAERIWIRDASREALNEIPDLIKGARATPPDSPGTAGDAPVASPATPRTEVGASEGLKLSRGADSDQAKQLAAVACEAESAAEPRELGTLRETMVFATGNPDADLMFVGEAPGYDEEKQREPFVGKAGQLLTKIIGAMAIQREDVYISNIVKFRPGIPNQGTSNRKPTSDEMASCLPFIQKEIAVVQPKAIVALGATAAEGLLGFADSVARMRNHWHEFQGIPVRVTYHPSYLLRNGALSEKRKVWEDILEVMERIDLPISDKQRGFFLPK